MFGVVAIVAFIAALICQFASVSKGVWDAQTFDAIGFLAITIHLVTGWLPLNFNRQNQNQNRAL
jgi:hypothetical protein